MSTAFSRLPHVIKKGNNNANLYPKLVNINVRKRPMFIPVVPNVSNAPFGLQRKTVLDVHKDNGIDGKFQFPLQKLVFNYCDFGGSSSVMKEYIKTKLIDFAQKNPQFEIIIQPRPYHHPLIRAYYNNGFYKYQCVRKFSLRDIDDVVNYYRNSSGMSPIKPKFPIFTNNESLRGIWSPFKDPKIRVDHKPQAPKFLYSNNF
jgi:large subunit ribosomal protein L43